MPPGFRSGQQAQHVLDALLNEEQAGRFQWLEETAGKTDTDTIAFPRLDPATRAKAQQLGFCHCLTIELA